MEEVWKVKGVEVGGDNKYITILGCGIIWKIYEILELYI